MRLVSRHTADEPWVTNRFRRLIWFRQYAWTYDEFDSNKKLCSNINGRFNHVRQHFFCQNHLSLGGSKQTDYLVKRQNLNCHVLPGKLKSFRATNNTKWFLGMGEISYTISITFRCQQTGKQSLGQHSRFKKERFSQWQSKASSFNAP